MTVERLAEYGLARMDEGEVEDFLHAQRTGVLGLPAPEGPYLLPMSYGYDGSDLYFTYVLGEASRKRELSDRADAARFLVYTARSPYVWRSVLLSGSVRTVPEDRLDAVEDALADVWRPELFESAEGVEGVDRYQFEVREAVGVRHTGLPPGFEAEGGDGT